MIYHCFGSYILLDDDNRVKLSVIAGRQDSDFINASFIEVSKDSIKYYKATNCLKDASYFRATMLRENSLQLKGQQKRRRRIFCE